MLFLFRFVHFTWSGTDTHCLSGLADWELDGGVLVVCYLLGIRLA